MVPRCGKQSLHGAIHLQAEITDSVPGPRFSEVLCLRNSPEVGCQNGQSLVSSIERPATASQAAIAISGDDKAIVLDPAAHAIKAVIAQCFDPYHADSTKNWPHSISVVRMMHRDAKSAFPDFTWHKCDVRQTVEPVTAQIMSHGLHDLGRTGPHEAERPVDLHPGSSSTLSYKRIRVDLMRVQVGWETVDRFRQHKRYQPQRAFSGP